MSLGVSEEPNSTVEEASVPEPFKTYCFLVLETCQERPVFLDTKWKPCLHISSVSSRSLGRKQSFPSNSCSSEIPRLPYSPGINVASDIHDTTEHS